MASPDARSTKASVAPATLGLYNGIGLVLGYAPFLQLGILNGLGDHVVFNGLILFHAQFVHDPSDSP